MKTTILLFALTSIAALATPVSLFNGTDLNGWVGKGYTVEDGAITCNPKSSNLRTEKQYTNYVLELDFKLPPGGNNGIGIHYKGNGNPAFSGMEIQVLDNSHPKYQNLKGYQFHGSLYTLQAAKRGFLKPVGQWNHKKITVDGDLVTVELNGTVINHANLANLEKAHPKHAGVKRRFGYICFCGHGAKVQYRNITIDELPSADSLNNIPVPAPPKDLKGFQKLYNERDLSGFIYSVSDIGHWQPKQKVLHYDGKSTSKEKNLWTEKSYADFILYCDWRWVTPPAAVSPSPDISTTGQPNLSGLNTAVSPTSQNPDSGIFLRGSSNVKINIGQWPTWSGEIPAFHHNPGLTQEVRDGAKPKQNADNPIGQWNRFKITLKGDRLNVILNDKIIINNAQLPGVVASGRIALQHNTTPIEFANLYIKELK